MTKKLKFKEYVSTSGDRFLFTKKEATQHDKLLNKPFSRSAAYGAFKSIVGFNTPLNKLERTGKRRYAQHALTKG